jgi:hypothetical protein
VGRYRFVAVAVAVAGVCGALAPSAWTAPPPQSTPVEFVLTGCDGPTGTLTGFKQPSGGSSSGGEAAALHLTTGGMYIFMEAFPTGDPDNPFFTTLGFDHNNLELVTCTLSQPDPGFPVTFRGLITPVG